MDSTSYDFPEAEAGGFGPLEPPKTNPPCTNPPSHRPNFNFLANMVANRPWLATYAIAIPSAEHPLPKHPEKLLPKFGPDNDVTPEDHIKQFMLSLRLWMCNMKMWFADCFHTPLLVKLPHGSLV